MIETPDIVVIPEPPSYEETTEATANTNLPTNELISLSLEGESVVLRNSQSTILYELTQVPSTGKGKTFGIQQVVYKPSPPYSVQPKVKSRLRHLYDVRAPNFLPPSLLGTIAYRVESQLGSRYCFKDGAYLVKGKSTPIGTIGRSWHVWTEVFINGKRSAGVVLSTQQKRFDSNAPVEWRDCDGQVIAIEIRSKKEDTKPSLALQVQISEKLLHLLVVAWCSVRWHEGKVVNTTSMSFKDFIRTVQTGKGHGSKRPFGIWAPI